MRCMWHAYNKLSFLQSVQLITLKIFAFCPLELPGSSSISIGLSLILIVKFHVQIYCLEDLDGPALLKSDLRRLQLIQNSAVTQCGHRKRDHISKSIKEIRFLTMHKRCLLQSCTLFIIY